MRTHVQQTSVFFLRPRIRLYRRPTLIWVRWLGRSIYIDWASTVPPHDEGRTT